MRKSNVMVGVSDDTQTSWVSRLTAGDKVIQHGRNGLRVVKVARATKTQLVILDGDIEVRYSRKDGWQIGGSVYNGSFLLLYTDEEGERILLRQAQNRVYHHCRYAVAHNFSNLTMEQCTEVIACFRRVGLIDDVHGTSATENPPRGLPSSGGRGMGG